MYVMTNNAVARLFDGADTPPTITTGGDIPNGTAWPYLFEIYYVRNSTVPQLSRKFLRWNGASNDVVTEDLAAGVENLHFLFGRDTDDDGEVDTYDDINDLNTAPGGATAAWAQVSSIEAYMLVRNAVADPQYIDEKSYVLGDITPVPNAANNNFRRMVMHTSVSMRNMQLVLRGGGT